MEQKKEALLMQKRHIKLETSPLKRETVKTCRCFFKVKRRRFKKNFFYFSAFAKSCTLARSCTPCKMLYPLCKKLYFMRKKK